ncbi:hypothetical protein [[Pseudomonas] boreopolis]|uniref:Uncharacterized protein n=1 Tax=Xanthomonas boreopolis TaxID=86183 RepID=A0A919F7F4_9XANT|nr:hypothetical protein GCM10009090_16220 [[Pseudomonas] boreopolis]
MIEPEEVLAVIDAAIDGMESPVRERRGHRDHLIDARAAAAELIEREKAQREALETCERWFAKHSAVAPLINGGVAEHPMLTMIRAALGRVQGGVQ